MSVKPKTNLWLDVILFIVFLLIFSPALTGLPIHEWLSLAFIVTIVLHLFFHWQWLVKVTRGFFRKLFHQSRLNYLVNLLFFLAMTAALLSGVLISRSVLDFLGIQLGNVSREWEMLHRLTADWSLILLGLHVALHFKWVVFNLNRYLVKPIGKLFSRNNPKLAHQAVLVDEK